MKSTENKNKMNQKNKSPPSKSDDKKYPDKKDTDDNGIVVTPTNPESQEWHARESVSKEGNNNSERSKST